MLVSRPEVLLRRELDDVRERLGGAEGPDAVGPVAVLEAAEQLALGEQHDRDDLHGDREEDDRLDDLDAPRLGVADVGETGSHAGVTSTRPASSASAELAGDAGLEEDGALGHGGAQRDRRARRACRRSRRHAVAVRRRRGAAASAGDSSARWSLAQELQRGRELDLGRGPDRAERPEAQRAVRRRRVAAASRGRTGRRRPAARRRPRRVPASARRARRSRRASGRRRRGRRRRGPARPSGR